MRLTYILLLVIFLVFAAQSFIPNLTDRLTISTDSLISRPWTIITSIFAHGDILHLLSNSIVLFFFGIAVESEFGRRQMLIIFILGALLGSALSLAIYPAGTSFLGASSGIFALVGAGMLARPMGIGLYGMFPLPLALLGMLYAVYDVWGVLSGDVGIAYAGHFGGLAVGLIWGFNRTGIGHGIAILILALIIVMALPIILQALFSHIGISV